MTAAFLPHARRWLGMVTLGAATLLGGCVVAPVEPSYTYTTYGAPPPVRYEAVPVAPYPTYVWTPGIWMWGGARYNWRPGYWGPPHHHGWGGGPRWRR